MSIRNEIKSQIVRAGFTMQEVVDRLADEYDWSDSVSNLSAKLQRESIRYKEVMELADVLSYDLIWQKRRESERNRFIATMNKIRGDASKADIRNPLRYLLMNAVASRSVSGSFQLPLT